MCKLCENRPVWEFTNKRKLCRNCFIKHFEKKFLYTNRKFNLIKPGDTISIKENGDFKTEVLKYILKSFKDKLMIQINPNSSKIAITSDIDTEAKKFLWMLINKDTDFHQMPPFYKNGKNIIIKPLYLFLDEEILLYARLKKIKYKSLKENKTPVNFFLDKLEKKHPEVKRAVMNSYLKTIK